MITVLILQLRYVCATLHKRLSKVSVNIKARQYRQVVSNEILTIQAIKFNDVMNCLRE